MKIRLSSLNQRKARQRGIVTLVVTTGVLLSSGLMGLYVSKSSVLEQKLTNNSYQSKQAFEAAEAGIEYGANYLNKNWRTLTHVSNNNGIIDGASTPLTMSQSNSSKSVVSFINPDKNTTELIKISASGKSSDNASGRTVSQLLKFMPFLQTNKIPQVPITVKKKVKLSGSVKIFGLSTYTCGPPNIAVWSGAQVKASGAVKINNKKAKSGSAKKYIVSGDAKLANASYDSFFRNYFGSNPAHFKEFSGDQVKYYNGNANLDGVKGEVIWVNGDLSISSQTNIGSSSKPVVLIVEGDLKVTGGADIKGFVFVKGDYDGAGNSTIEGSLVVNGEAKITGTQDIYYDENLLYKIRNGNGIYVKIPGSWIDA